MLSGPGNTRPQYQHYSGHSQHPPAWMSMMNTLNVLSGSFKERHLTLVWAGPGAELWQLPMVEQVPCPVAGHWSPLLWWTLSMKISIRKTSFIGWLCIIVYWCDAMVLFMKWWKWGCPNRHSATDHDCFFITVHIRPRVWISSRHDHEWVEYAQFA